MGHSTWGVTIETNTPGFLYPVTPGFHSHSSYGKDMHWKMSGSVVKGSNLNHKSVLNGKI